MSGAVEFLQMSNAKFEKVGKFIEEHREICHAFHNVRIGVLESSFRRRRPYLLLMFYNLDDPGKCHTDFFLTMIQVLKAIGEPGIIEMLHEGRSLYQIFWTRACRPEKDAASSQSRNNESGSLGDSI